MTQMRRAPALLALPLVAGIALTAGCGSSSPEPATTTPTATRSAAGPDAAGICPGQSTKRAYRLTFANASTTQPVRWAFSEVDCSDWMGRTPLAYTPIIVSNNGSATMRVDPACDPALFTARLSVPGAARPDAVASLRLKLQNGACRTDTTRLWIFHDGAWKSGTSVTVPVGGSSWVISMAVGAESEGTVTVREA